MKHPAHCCQECGEPIGYIGRFFEWLFGRVHTCKAGRRPTKFKVR